MFQVSDIQKIVEETNYNLFNIPWNDILPKQIFVKKKNWEARLCIDVDIDNLLNLFLEALDLYENKQLYGCIFENNSIDNIKIVKVANSLDELNSLLFDYGENNSFLNHCFLTNETIDFLFVKESEREIFYVFGEKKFVSKIISINFNSYIQLFQNSMKEYLSLNEEYKVRKMKLFWETYIALD
jgi:hypothetical protein